jgi:signal transduction histidine kinase
MKKRNIIINKKFQLNLAMSFAAISALTMTIIIVICSYILINNNTKLENINVSQQQYSETQKDYNNTKELLNKNNEEIKNIIHRNNGIIIILIISSIIQVLLIYYLMLRRSHRISGPIYLLNNYFDEIIKGNYPKIRKLRENDDFHDLFEKFEEMNDLLRKNSMPKKKK